MLSALTALPLALAAPVDEGMWTFDNPPVEAIQQRYGVKLTPSGSSACRSPPCASPPAGRDLIVSASGLVMTNHHVDPDILDKLSSAKNNLLDAGFWAATLEDERALGPDVHLDVLWSIEDVTARVEAAAARTPAEAGAARMSAMTAIEDAAKARPGMHTEVVTLYQGGRYHLYTYRRFEDIRLVFAPEKSIAFYGGDGDDEYPRFCLDVTCASASTRTASPTPPSTS